MDPKLVEPLRDHHLVMTRQTDPLRL